MPTLPDRPDLDQLRRQARELRRAAANGEPPALARLRAVSDRVTLSSAQLALAREYGFPSWNALRVEAQRRRNRSLATGPNPDAIDDRWSFGGGDEIHTAAGTLRPTGLIVNADGAVLGAWLTPAEHHPSGPPFADLTVVDDRGARYTLRQHWVPIPRDEPAPDDRPDWLGLGLHPVPPRDRAWLELRDPHGHAARLPRSARGSARVSAPTPLPASAAERELTLRAEFLLELHLGPNNRFVDFLAEARGAAIDLAIEIRRSGELSHASRLDDDLIRLCAVLVGQSPVGDLPVAWSGMLDGARRTDGRRLNVDLAVGLPAVDGTTTRIDSIVAGPDSWYAYLRVWPGWWSYRADGQVKWETLTVRATDDRGGQYLSTRYLNSGHGDHETVTLRFLPRIDPLARALTLSFAGTAEQVTAALRLAPPSS